ncbi:hypothetical protein BY458DRAFT_553467 [Sporodiniella umbellata]|nr:hypothetical protein BY458DRAFT_553467 [Sporodiniella umbellata]
MDKPSQNNLYAGLIIYRTQRKNNIEYLLLNDTFTNKKHWFCPKGQVIGTEDVVKCALRETFEVAGLRPSELRVEEGFAIEIRYLSGTRAKKVKYYLAQLIDHHVRLLPNAEGIHMQWFNLATASDKVAFKSMQDALKHAQTFVESKQQRPQRRKYDLSRPTESQVEHSQNSEHHYIHQNHQRPQQQSQQTQQQQQLQSQQYQQQQQQLLQNQKGQLQHQVSNENNPLYKTRLCERFETEGSCPYGPKCNFAHGIEDLRGRVEPQYEKEEILVDGNQLFKTKLCEKFMRERFCQYGPKCHFAHGENELKERPLKAMEQRREDALDSDHEAQIKNGSRPTKYSDPTRLSENNWRSGSAVAVDRDGGSKYKTDSNQAVVDREKKKLDVNREGSWRSKADNGRGLSWRNKTNSPIPTDSIPIVDQTKLSVMEESEKNIVKDTDSYTKKEDMNVIPKMTTEEPRRPVLLEQQCRTPKPSKKQTSVSLDSDEKSWMKVVKLSREEQEELENDCAIVDNDFSVGNKPLSFMNGLSQRKTTSSNKTAQIEAIISDLKKVFLKPFSAVNTKGTLTEDVKEVTRIEMRNDLSKSQLFYILFAGLLEDIPEALNVLSILKTRDHLFKTFIKNDADQLLLLKSWDQFVTQRKPTMVSKTAAALSHWYDCEMVDEEVFIQWYNTLEKGSPLEKKSEKFIEWLNEEEEDED